jgi:hypothetical protein
MDTIQITFLASCGNSRRKAGDRSCRRPESAATRATRQGTQRQASRIWTSQPVKRITGNDGSFLSRRRRTDNRRTDDRAEDFTTRSSSHDFVYDVMIPCVKHRIPGSMTPDMPLRILRIGRRRLSVRPRNGL